MRISDDRYSRDRLRLDLALRFIHLEARTHTIRAWTGLTDDRIRKLYRTYLYESRRLRRRAPPRQVAAPGGVLHPFTAHAARGRRFREREQPVRPHHAADDLDRQARRNPARPWRAAHCCARRSKLTVRSSANRRYRSSTRSICSARCSPERSCALAHCRDCSGVLVTDRLALRTPVCNECAASRVPAEADSRPAAHRAG